MRRSEPQAIGVRQWLRRATVEPWLCAVALSSACAGATSGVAPVGSSSASEPVPEASAASSPPGIPELVLTAALPLAIEGDFQPSGLLLHEGQLLTVSDKHDDTIFAIERGTSSATLRPFIRFELPTPESPALDLEGLTAAPDGGWWLASESQLRVLHVQAAGGGDGAAGPGRGLARWLTPSLHAAGAAKGCFHVPNAGFEGIDFSPPDRLLLAIERQPRALLELSAHDAAAADVQLMPATTYPAEPGRDVDFADLTRSGGQLYALVRNAHLIVRLEREPGGAWREGSAFSFRGAENDLRYRYGNRKYGLAEGLAMTEREVFVVLDNNGQARAGDGNDRRPLLFVFDRPSSL